VSGEHQPFFRFNPNAYQPGRAFEATQESCEICHRPSIWKYTGNFYSQKRPIVCACCISDGSLEKALDDDWSGLHDISIEGADPELEHEVMCRTPGVACFNPYEWPVIDGIPMAFLLYGDEDSEFWNLPEIKEAVNTAFGDWPWDGKKPGSYVLLFKQVDGTQYRAVIDPD
jgi:uncharacterized protein